jgi:hypothetical protein
LRAAKALRGLKRKCDAFPEEEHRQMICGEHFAADRADSFRHFSVIAGSFQKVEE